GHQVNTLVARYGGVRFITTHQPSLDQYPVRRFPAVGLELWHVAGRCKRAIYGAQALRLTLWVPRW
ncbi:MAG: hypothetical protein M0038_01245, partial [Pseudomonadota bacterium]|nr:hypothetical protein [Pseudomonadota bacterium]